MILLAAVPCVAVAEPRHDLVAGALEKAAIFIVIARAARPWTVAIGRIAARRGIAELAPPQRDSAFAAPAARFPATAVITRTAVVALNVGQGDPPRALGARSADRHRGAPTLPVIK